MSERKGLAYFMDEVRTLRSPPAGGGDLNETKTQGILLSLRLCPILQRLLSCLSEETYDHSAIKRMV